MGRKDKKHFTPSDSRPMFQHMQQEYASTHKTRNTYAVRLKTSTHTTRLQHIQQEYASTNTTRVSINTYTQETLKPSTSRPQHM